MRLSIRLTLIALALGAFVLAPIHADVTPRAEADGAAIVSVRVMSFNVRNSLANDGENAWERRSAAFFKTVQGFQPDLIGFQEVLAAQYDAMVAWLTEYEFSGGAREDGKRKGEWSLVGFRRDRFRAVGQGDFWLSEQPDVPGSKSWDAALPRLCSWVRLREAGTGREFIFANTHFDHKGVVARRKAGEILNRELARIADRVPIILTGDLNISEEDPAYRILVGADATGSISWIDAYREVHPVRRFDELSFHGFAGGSTGSRIDYIFHTAHFATLDSAIDRSCWNGRFPSDHYAVTAVLVLRP